MLGIIRRLQGRIRLWRISRALDRGEVVKIGQWSCTLDDDDGFTMRRSDAP